MTVAPAALSLAAAFLIAPLLTSLILAVQRRPLGARPDLRLSGLSTLAFALAYNLTFLVQELGLVIPKAFTPGLKPTLFHNNHNWTGHHPLENLFQGTGALATVLVGLGCAAWVTLRPPRSDGVRLFAIWMALLGVLSALPQVLIGTVIPQNDVGRAMDFFGMAPAAKLAASVLAVVAMAAACRWAAARFLALGRTSAGVGFMLWTAALPALAAVILIVPFRVPGAPIEILLPPGVAAVTAALWLQAWSWFVRPAGPPTADALPPMTLAAALALLLAVFHISLRPGVPFY